jgi:hypothetical protein
MHADAAPRTHLRDNDYTAYRSGAACEACGDRVHPCRVEYDLNYPDGHRTFRLPLGCAGLWEAIRLKRGRDPAR